MAYGVLGADEASKLAREKGLGPGDIIEMKACPDFADGSRVEWHLEVIDEYYNNVWTPYRVYPTGEQEKASWAPLPGSQFTFFECPVFECLYEGTRGPGKTVSLLMDFVKDVGKGHGKNWRGILFRKQFGDLDDVVRKIEAEFEKIYGEQDKGGNWKGGKWRFLRSKSEYMVEWQTGENLLLRHMKDVHDYEEYHGHEYPWIGWEELTQWVDPDAYLAMFSCCRPTGSGVPTRIRSTTNPYGPGHNWVKKRFKLPDHRARVIKTPGEKDRVAIHGALRENFIVLHGDPDYDMNVRVGARNAAQMAAWMDGDWNVTAGGMIDDLWNPDVHIIPTFPPSAIPRGWHKSRAYDHGQARPFSVGWWLESNGEPIVWEGRRIGAVRGDLILWKEWYGTTGEINEGIRLSARKIARGILDRERDWGLYGKVHPGPADNEIWNLDQRGTGRSPAEDMADEGVHWEAASKTKGSRRRGWELLRDNLRGAIPHPDGTREEPGFFVCDCNRDWIELVPPMPCDEIDPDDIPKGYEDHSADMCFTADTEVLTERGWIFWPEVHEDDVFATVSPVTEALEYQKASEIVSLPWDGDIIIFDNKTQLAVTPNHWMAVRSRSKKYSDFTLKQARDITIWDKIICAPKTWYGRDSLDLPFDCDDGDMAELIGWWVADGWLRKLTENAPFQRDVAIAQYNLKGRRAIEDLLSKTPWKWGYRNGSYITTNKELYEFFRDGYTSAADKHVPDCIKRASPYLIQRFMNGYISGDGWFRKNGMRCSATVSKKLADDLQELYVKLGCASSQRVRKAKPSYSIKGRDGKLITGTNTQDQFWVEEWAITTAMLRDNSNKPNFRYTHYKGMVYCAQVPNGTLVVRRNGRVSITGNTRYRLAWDSGKLWRREF